MSNRLLCVLAGLFLTAISLIFLLAPMSGGWTEIILRVMGAWMLLAGVYALFVGLFGSDERVRRTAEGLKRGV